MKNRWFVRGDIDGFFGLFIDNLLQLMLIKVLCENICKFPDELITGRILPGAAISILLGNLFYAWQARQLMKKTGRDDITALPYGINTPSLVAYIVLIMAPVYYETKNVELAWQAGLFACLCSGIMEIAGAFVGDWLRRHTPRAALLTALAGIAITFIAVGFVFQIFASPAIAILPMMLILITYASRVKLPFGLPGGFVAVVIGVVLAWFLKFLGLTNFATPQEQYVFALRWPAPVPKDVFALISDPMGWKYMAVIVPMGLFNVIGSLQNLESAEAGGDRFETRPSLLANGVGTIVAAFLGSAFPTTIYIGHPAWKAMGARSAYSVINGIVVAALCLIGGITLVLHIVPIEVTLGILLWIGIIITAQAFQEVPKSHALAVAFGLIPALAAWARELLIEPTIRAGNMLLGADLGKAKEAIAKAGVSLAEAGIDLDIALSMKAMETSLLIQGVHIRGVIALSQGFLLSSMVLAAVLVFVIERKFLKSAAWCAAAAILSFVGLIHAFDLTAAGVKNKFGLLAAPEFGAMYGLSAALMVILHFCGGSEREEPQSETETGDDA